MKQRSREATALFVAARDALDAGADFSQLILDALIATVNVIDSMHFSDPFCLESCKDESSGGP